jgi:hypothetical protein
MPFPNQIVSWSLQHRTEIPLSNYHAQSPTTSAIQKILKGISSELTSISRILHRFVEYLNVFEMQITTLHLS